MPEAMTVPQTRFAQVKFSLAKTANKDSFGSAHLSKNDKPIRKPGKHLSSTQDSLPACEETSQELIHLVE